MITTANRVADLGFHTTLTRVRIKRLLRRCVWRCGASGPWSWHGKRPARVRPAYKRFWLCGFLELVSVIEFGRLIQWPQRRKSQSSEADSGEPLPPYEN